MGIASLTLNIAAMIISLVALASTVMLALRQLTIMNQTNVLPVITSYFPEFRSREFLEHLDYVTNELQRMHSPDHGIFGLPEPARFHAFELTNFYEAMGTLVAWNIIDERIASSTFGTQCDRSWRLLEPFILREREIRGGSRFQVYFEDLVCRIRETPPPVVERRLGLKQLPRDVEEIYISDDDLAAQWLRAGAHWYDDIVSRGPSKRADNETS